LLKDGNKVNLWAFKSLSIRLVVYSLVVEGKIPNGILVSAVQAGIAHFRQVFSNENQIEIRLLDSSFGVATMVNNKEKNLFDWWQLCSAAELLQKNNYRAELQVLHNHIKEQTTNVFWEKFSDLYLLIMQNVDYDESLLQDIEAEAATGVVEFIGLKEDGRIEVDNEDNVRKNIWLPLIKLYDLAYKRKSAEFNDLLAEYLKYKNRWILLNKEEDNSSYWIDIPLLACCSFAKDRQVVISVKSEYIPEFGWDDKYIF
jgi:hypothetical protein